MRREVSRPSLGRSALTVAAWLAGGTGLAAAEYPITVMHAQSGPLAFVGAPVTRGVVMAAEEVNATGFLGQDKIKLIVEDYGSDRNQAITLISRAANVDKSLVAIGPTDSTAGSMVAPVANDLKMPMITTAITSQVLKAGPWSFKVTATADVLMTALAKYAAEHNYCKRLVTTYNRDNDGQIANKNVFRDFLVQRGTKVVDEYGMSATEADFTAAATRIASLDPDCIYTSITASQSANMIVQFKQNGVPDGVKVFGSASQAADEYVKAGGRAVEGTYSGSDYNPFGTSEANQRFIKAFQERYKAIPDNWAAVGYTSLYMAATAIKNAGPNPDREKVRAALTALKDLPSLLGSGTFSLDAERAPQYGASVLMIKDGKVVSAP